MMTANKPQTMLLRAPTFSLLLISHGGINPCKPLDLRIQSKAIQLIGMSLFSNEKRAAQVGFELRTYARQMLYQLIYRESSADWANHRIYGKPV